MSHEPLRYSLPSQDEIDALMREVHRQRAQAFARSVKSIAAFVISPFRAARADKGTRSLPPHAVHSAR